MSKSEGERLLDIAEVNAFHRRSVVVVTHALPLHLHQMHPNLQRRVRRSPCAALSRSNQTHTQGKTNDSVS
jgi:hypothetical protein